MISLFLAFLQTQNRFALALPPSVVYPSFLGPKPDIAFVDISYRVYNGTEWVDGPDRLVSLGFDMFPVPWGESGCSAGTVATSFGEMKLDSGCPLFVADYHTTLQRKTEWAYCGSQQNCFVYLEQCESLKPRFARFLSTSYAAGSNTIVLTLPVGVAALDFYLDDVFSLDQCNNPSAPSFHFCTVTAYSTGKRIRPLSAARDYDSTCAGPYTGRYFGFFSVYETQGISHVSIVCSDTLPKSLGLVRLGARPKPR